jgi:putative peptide zinc metalloprotease protein
VSQSLFSSSWYRIAELRPRLRAHTEVHRHRYRGELWYLIQNHITGRFHRFAPETYVLIGLMDGRRTLDQIWESACERLQDDMPTQQEVIQLLGELHSADVIQTDIPPDMGELHRRFRTQRRQQLLAWIKSPLSVRLPIWDPNRWLDRSQWVAQVVYSHWGALVWLSVVAVGLVLAGLNWQALTHNLGDQVFGMENLLLLSLVYPFVKAIHEFGHAYAIKRWGGEVHEMGIMLLVFVPVPYVEASAAYAFSSKYQRMLVGAAGILTEIFLAALAMIVWTLVEPGAVRAVAFNVMLLAGVSTILFNGNPLLRFDGYYVLADWLEIPNLGMRANRQLGYVLKRFVLNIDGEQAPARSRREGAWLVSYSVASFSYRMMVMIGIALFVASKAFVIGVILALWAVYGFLIQPAINILKVLKTDEEMIRRRPRLFLTGGGFTAALLWAVFLLPFPRSTVTEGVLWMPDKASIYARTRGVVDQLLVEDGESVTPDTALIRMVNPELETDIDVTRARMKELQARYNVAQAAGETTEYQLIEEEFELSKNELQRLVEEQQSLLISSHASGVFHYAQAEHLPGRHLYRGQPVGYVLQPGEYRARVIIDQANIDAMRSDIREVSIRFAEDFHRPLPAQMVREVPSAHRELPSMAMSVEGGGQLALDPSEQEVPTAFKSFFQFEITIKDVATPRIGERIYARFRHTPEPLGYRWLRAARRLLLEQLDY